MKIKINISYIIYLFIFISIIPKIQTKIVYREEDEGIFPTIDNENLIVYRVATTFINIANFFHEKFTIMKKWYRQYQEEAIFNPEEYHALINHNNNEDNINKNDSNDDYSINNDSNINKSQTQEIKIYQNIKNPNLLDYKKKGKENNIEDHKEESKKKTEEEEEEELFINRYHYSSPNYILTNKNFDIINEINNESMNSMKEIFKRDSASGKCDPLLEYCDSQCKTNIGEPLTIDESLAPMYNCSGRFLTNFYDKNKLPLQECNTCLKNNVTCLNWCCQLMDTSVNSDIPKTITVETVVNNTKVNSTTPNPNLSKVCYCPIDRYGPNCQYTYDVLCNMTLLEPLSECYSKDGQKLKGLKYYEKSNNCPLFNYTETITMKYNMICYQKPTAQFNLSLSSNNFTFHNKYILNESPLFISKSFIPIQFTARLWNFNHLGLSNEVSITLNNTQLIGNETINIEIDLGKYYLPNDKMKSIFNGGRIVIEAGFAYGHYLMGTYPNPTISYINIGNYFKNMDFFEKEVILKTIKQVLSIIIPIVAGSVLLIAIFFLIIYILYKKSRPMKINC